MAKSCSHSSRVSSTLILLFLVTACTRDQELPFETIEHLEWSGTGDLFEKKEPGLIVIARPEEASEIDNKIRSEAKTQLEALDYSKNFALLVFQGWKPSNGYVSIHHITQLR